MPFCPSTTDEVAQRLNLTGADASTLHERRLSAERTVIAILGNAPGQRPIRQPVKQRATAHS